MKSHTQHAILADDNTWHDMAFNMKNVSNIWFAACLKHEARSLVEAGSVTRHLIGWEVDWVDIMGMKVHFEVLIGRWLQRVQFICGTDEVLQIRAFFYIYMWWIFSSLVKFKEELISQQEADRMKQKGKARNWHWDWLPTCWSASKVGCALQGSCSKFLWIRKGSVSD